jgi:Ca2+-binding RTX toxin-like protein
VVAVIINNTSTTTLATGENSGRDTVVAGTGGLFVVDNGSNNNFNVGGGSNAATLNGTGATFGGDGNNLVTLNSTLPGAASTVVGTPSSSDTIKGTALETGNLVYTDGGGNALINPTGGDVTIIGGTGTETVFGGTAYFSSGQKNELAFTGSLTVTNGTGYFAGGTKGYNNIASSSVGGTTLVGGGANDTLTSYGPGDMLVAGNGISTLDGSHSAGGDYFFASSTAATYMFGSQSVGDVFFFSTSTAWAPSNAFKGAFVAAHTAPNSALDSLNNNVSNTFAVSSGAEFGTVYDFISGVDKVAVATVQGAATLYAPVSGTGQYLLVTSTGTNISFFSKIQASDIQGVAVTTKLV